MSTMYRILRATTAGGGAAVVGATGLTMLADAEPSVKAKQTAKPIVPIICEDGAVVTPWEAPSREKQLQRLQEEEFDVLVIGGGATGAGCALDCATRGLKVAMVERNDFAAGTSGRSTKLIHGGVRYLEAAFKRLDIASYRLVEEALEEREHMLSAAPYMNQPLPIMIPIYKWWEVPYMYIGTKVYDLVAGAKRYVPGSYFITKTEAIYQFPNLSSEGLKGAIVYYDGQMNDTRMNLSIVLTAAQSGAAISNRVEVIKLLKDESGKVAGARVRDTMNPSKEWDIKARSVINATGPFSDGIRKMDNPDSENIIVPAAGVHIVLPDHFSPERMGLIIPKTKDGRVLFFLPWENATVSGTTDSKSDITMTPSPTQEEVDFILEESGRYLDKPVKASDVRSAWSGIRPLAKDPSTLGSDTSKISREHVIEVSDSNLVTIAGGKWTTYRRMAQDTVDRVVGLLPNASLDEAPCQTRGQKIIGADRLGEVCGRKFDFITITLREKYELEKDVAAHLTRNYGTRALQIAEIVKSGYNKRGANDRPRRIVAKYPYLEAEVVFAVRQEYAVKAVDVIARRTRLAFIDSEATLKAVPEIVGLMGDLLNWSRARRAEEIKECEEFLATMNNK